MRPIDADELRKNVLKWMPSDPCGKEEKEFPFETDICVSMIMEIDETPTIEPEQRWIPCSERLPEKEGWYITTVESEKTGKRRIENDLFAVDIALAHGHTPNKFCKDGYRQRTVAWMPFPEPYCGGE